MGQVRNNIASLLPRAGPVAESWSPEQAARFAAHRDYLFVKLLARDRAALAAAREVGLVGTAPCGVEKQHEKEEPSSKPKRSRKKTDARKAIERKKLEAKHAKRAAAAAAPVPPPVSATGAAAAASPPQQPKPAAAAAPTPSGIAPAETDSARPMEEDRLDELSPRGTFDGSGGQAQWPTLEQWKDTRRGSRRK